MSSSTYQTNLLNYQLHEIYLRPLLTKHEQSKPIQYEDLMESWKVVMNRLTFKKKKDGDNDHDNNNSSSSSSSSSNNGDLVEYDEKDDNHVLIFQKVSNQYLFLSLSLSFFFNNYYKYTI